MTLEATYTEWKASKLLRMQRQMRHLVRNIYRARMLKNKYYAEVGAGNASAAYWWGRYRDKEIDLRKDLRVLGLRINTARRPETEAKFYRIVDRLKEMGVSVWDMREGSWNNYRLVCDWDIHAHGIAMHARKACRKLAEATYYTNLKFTDRSLDHILKERS